MFRFTIRDVLWLTVVAAVAFSWWGDRAKLYEDKVAAEKDARDFWQSTLPPAHVQQLQRKYAPDGLPPTQPN
jgi:hypothetical protein